MPVAARDHRFYDADKGPDQRSPFQRDRDRILYTSAFRRLAGITQVVSPTERALVHNRLTHTLEVAQIGRRIAEKLCKDQSLADLVAAIGGIDPDVAEAASLAHDLGHPPFGHIAEEVLDDLALETKFLDGFNGNAQSFRIVTKLAVRRQDFPGLNLTRATLNAMLKYPWLRQTSGTGRNKWGAYESEQDVFHWTRTGYVAGDQQRSVEAEIMDWADDIAYAVHDMEDFYRAGLIPLDALITNSREQSWFLDGSLERLNRGGAAKYTADDLGSAFREVIAPLPARTPFRGGRDQRAGLRYFTSFLIGRFINAFTLVPEGESGCRVRIEPHAEMLVTVLKQLTWHYVIESPVLATQQYGQREIIRRLFEIFRDEAYSRTNRDRGTFLIFPEDYREQLREDPRENTRNRLVIDLIASMTEPQARGMYHRLTGITGGSAMEPI